MQNTTTWMQVKHISEITDPNDMLLMLYPYERFWESKTQILNFTGKKSKNYKEHNGYEYWYLFTFRNHKYYSAQDLKIFKHCLN